MKKPAVPRGHKKPAHPTTAPELKFGGNVKVELRITTLDGLQR